MAERGPDADVLDDLAMPVPMAVICELLGIPYDDRARFRRWADQLLSTTVKADGEMTVTEESMANLCAFLRELIAERRSQPGDDLLSALIAARDEGDALSEDEMV